MSIPSIKSVAIIGAGASGKSIRLIVSTCIETCSGAATAAAFASENTFDVIRVFERRESPGGTWEVRLA